MTRSKRTQAYANALKFLLDEAKRGGQDEVNKMLWRWLYFKVTYPVVLAAPILYWLLDRIGSFIFKPNVLNSSYFVSVSAIVMLLGGLALYLLRETNRYFYGVIETGFAIAAIIHSAKLLPSQGPAGWATAVGAVYLLVRGLDNLVTGFKAPPKK